MMDCKTARFLIDLYPSSRVEIQGSEAAALDGHLAGCPDCDNLAKSEARGHARLSVAMLDVPIPEGLHARITARLRAERGENYRRWVGRSLRAAVAAAALVLLSWLVWDFFQKPPPDLDVQGLHDAIARNPSPDRERVEEEFKTTYQIKTVAPDQFDYTCLIWYGLVNCQGKPAPFLLFQRGDVTARVYILTDKDFNLANLPVSLPSSGGVTVKVWRKPGPDITYTYVIVYTGNSLDPVLLDNQQPAA